MSTFLGALALSLTLQTGQSLPIKAVQIDLKAPVKVGVASQPVAYHGNPLHIVSLGEAIFSYSTARLVLSPPPEPVQRLPGHWILTSPQKAEPQVTTLTDILSGKPLHFESGSFFSVTVKAAVAQYNKVDYRISCTLFDKDGILLGTAVAVEHVEYVRLGVMPTVSRDIKLDFDPKKNYERAAYAVFSISSPDVPKPPDGE